MDGVEVRKRLEAGEDPLELAIQKWKDIEEGNGLNGGTSNCALCKAYLLGRGSCYDCPADIDWGGCSLTPFTEFTEYECKIINGYKRFSIEKYYRLAHAERVYLESLRE